jgi:hypothetical protein
MNRVPPFPLWLGHAGDGRDLRRLYDLEIRARVELAAEEPPAPASRDLIVCRFPLVDGAGNGAAVLELAVRTLALLIKARVPSLVCCGAGMSRAPAVAACALALAEGGPPDEWLRRVTEHHPADVMPGLWRDTVGALQRLSGSGTGPGES